MKVKQNILVKITYLLRSKLTSHFRATTHARHHVCTFFHARDTAQEITILHYVAQPSYLYLLFKKQQIVWSDRTSAVRENI
jgi:hypothetical protein